MRIGKITNIQTQMYTNDINIIFDLVIDVIVYENKSLFWTISKIKT